MERATSRCISINQNFLYCQSGLTSTILSRVRLYRSGPAALLRLELPHSEGSRGGRLISRRHAGLRQTTHIRTGFPIHHFRGRKHRGLGSLFYRARMRTEATCITLTDGVELPTWVCQLTVCAEAMLLDRMMKYGPTGTLRV